MYKYIRAFEDIRKEDIKDAGGKGANLGEMTSAGIQVPPGGVLLSQAYDAYMSSNGIDPLMYDNAKDLRKAITDGSIPDDIKEEIRGFYETVCGPGSRVAVRSSATAEDLEDASFAGQQETYLNVTGIDMLLEKVKECYASLWGDRAVSYRKNSGYDREKVALAVVIQQMIESDSAGVMFTSDPAGDKENVHINASYGLGEAVVSGIVSPDEYILSRDGRIIKKVIGSKEVKIIYDPENRGTMQVPVDENERSRAVIDDKTLAELVAEGLRIEEHYGHPMDIEWAMKDGRICILQARSITTIKENTVKTFTERDFEGYPKVKPARGAMREGVLFNLEKTPTPYYPLDHDFGGCVGDQKGVLFSQIGLDFKGGMYPIDKDGISYQSDNKIRLNKNVFAIPKYLKLIGDVENNIKCADESLERCTSEFESEKKKEPATVKELGEALKRMRDLIGKTAYDRFLYALFPNAVEGMKVTKVLRKIDKDLNAYDVLEGLSYVTADINRAMKDICVYINKDPLMAACVMEKDYKTICSSYPGLGSKLTDFIEEFGSKSDFNCYCFISKTWREDPDRFINTLRPMLKSGGEAVTSLEEGLKKHEDLMKRVRACVSGKDYAKFVRRVKGLRHYHYIREATQYLWESEFEHCRKLLRKLSEVSGISYEDLTFLFADELFEACSKEDLEAKKTLIKARRDKRDFAVAYWDKCMKDALSGGGDSIKGIGASNGQVKGRVCIVRSPKEFYKLEKGDILVCKYTDPEWTPLFALAAGVVVDTGGTLSHAAIVAREYGIPAVLATGDATLRLHDGDTVLVDAGEGTVLIL
ncbi:MAG: phosphoenolpyruvate synthase [Lachnospiraceae bacterium]|nr:phosphoenolpyruvate synthase [Lachnospiraceae bacterium]